MDKDTLFSSFHKCVAPLNTTPISNWTLETGEDRYVKKLDTLAYLLIFIDAQLQQHRGLRDIAADLCHNEAFQRELGLRCISTSQLSERITSCHPRFFSSYFVSWSNFPAKPSPSFACRPGQIAGFHHGESLSPKIQVGSIPKNQSGDQTSCACSL